MGPPGGGRNPISARLLRHFNFIAFTEMEDSSKRKIFGSIFKSWVGKLSEKLGKTLGILMMLYLASNCNHRKKKIGICVFHICNNEILKIYLENLL